MKRLSEIACNQNPLVLSEKTSVKTACEAMRRRELGAVLVSSEDGVLVGIFTGRDAARRVLGGGRNGRSRLREVMTRAPVTMDAEQSAIDALRLMWDGGFRHLPLVEDGRVCGMISRNDFGSEERLTLDEERQYWEHMR